MTTAKTRRHAPADTTPAQDRHRRSAGIARRVAGAAKAAGSGALTLIGHIPGTVRMTRAGARDTANALQTLPDSTLRWLAASSVGLSTGLRLARAPRLIVAAGAVPALLAGAAIALRPIEPAADGTPAPTAGDTPA